MGQSDAVGVSVKTCVCERPPVPCTETVDDF